MMQRFFVALFVSLVFSSPLSAQTLYDDAVEAYNKGNDAHAFKAFKIHYTNTLDEDAAYYIALMYEEGRGVDKNLTLSNKWYKISAKRYYKVNANSYDHAFNKQRRFFFQNTDRIADKETKQTIQEMIEGRYEFKAHNQNYFLPFGTQKHVYPSYVASDEYTNREAEFQFSVRFDIKRNLLGLDEVYSGAFTQRSFWQIYAHSAPFRENNYMPELFVTIPWLDGSTLTSLRTITLGMAHQSNGQGRTEVATAETLANRSRSWNFLYANLRFQWGAALIDLKAWKRIVEDEATDDNPDLTSYIGHSSLTLTLPYKKLVATSVIRYNAKYDRGSFELNLSYPIYGRENIFWYAKVFSGYGESLIDYNTNITKSSFGLSFSR
jgi:phospholipase A1